MPKNLLVTISLSVILITSYLVYSGNNNLRPFFDQSSYRPGRKSELDKAINQAKYFYRLKKDRGEDFANGPCLSDALMPSWVVDIVHNPRQPIDDLAENQCPSYINGQAEHFVELDTEGNFVRAR